MRQVGNGAPVAASHALCVPGRAGSSATLAQSDLTKFTCRSSDSATLGCAPIGELGDQSRISVIKPYRVKTHEDIVCIHDIN